MTKRVREDYLTPELLQAQLATEDGDNAEANNKASDEVLGQRKIVRVKRHVQQTGEVTT